MTFFSRIIPSPLGNLIAYASDKGLCALNFEEYASKVLDQLLKKDHRPHQEGSSHPYLQLTAEWLNYYFAKKFTSLILPPLDISGSSFTQKVLTALKDIPLGSTTTYRQLAHQVEAPLAARAIGRVMAENKLVIILPCHRIIGAKGKLTGFSAGMHRKQWLLAHENTIR